ncbi:hypothetical protein CRE_09746 [Caenorhabditis remanei]|uniref:Uncharacterized protein n=1 Tax=Caenorhabditis remanei TaxID=31234 RepID=E3N4Z7_CAERE|nr:hypothetical protein CRE_09746 [Caenorhabditis remanei]
MKLQLLLLALALLIEPVHPYRARTIESNNRVFKKPDGAQQAEFLGSLSCPLNVVWCVQLMYIEEDIYIHNVVKHLPFVCSNGSRTLTSYAFLDYYGTDSLTFDDSFEPAVILWHDCSKNNNTYRYHHKHWRQSHHFNCTSYKYDLNLFELGEATDLDDVYNKRWNERNRRRTIYGKTVWAPPGFYEMPAPWGMSPAKFPTERCLKMDSDIRVRRQTYETALKNDFDGSSTSDVSENFSSPGTSPTPANSTTPF